MRRGSIVVALLGALCFCSPALAGDWLPHPADATWTYQWTDSVYNTTPTNEKVTVKDQKGAAFRLAWTTEGQSNAADAPVSIGTVSFQDTPAGLVNTDWASNAPPPSFPILCSTAGSCGNSLASTYYNVIWGARVPVLAEPLLKGTTWSATGGAGNDVTSTSTYLGTELVTVPAFPQAVVAAKVSTEIAQAGALGDPYGSGLRTTWWVYGVGPVKVVFAHSGGANAPITTALLQSTNQAPKMTPGDDDYFPLRKGLKGSYRWTNTKHFDKPEVQSFEIDQVSNASGRFVFKGVSGPIRVSAAYGFTARLDGVTNIFGFAKAASLAKLPPLGPRALQPDKRRHFFTPFDLMTFGFNPLIPAYPAAGASWTSSAGSRDFSVYGVVGKTTVTGVASVKVPAGRFRALVVGSTLRQAGFPFGSGTRTTWFAPGRGMVKLVFSHGDGSTSVVERLR